MTRNRRPPNAPRMQLRPAQTDRALQRVHMMGAATSPLAPQQPTAPAPRPTDDGYNAEDPEQYNYIPAIYTVSLNLGSEIGNTAANSVGLRPERFELRRITWATTEDLLAADNNMFAVFSSLAARAVELTWEDEFTKFFGNTPTLVASAFGDSNGFLDLPRPLLFQGKQALTINLRRVAWPWGDDPPPTTRWDFTFQGVGILPKNVQVSGSL